MSEQEALSTERIKTELQGIYGWQLDAGTLLREFKFASFPRAFSFMTNVAFVAEAQGHHPDWTNVYDTVSIRLNTHDAGGITSRDFRMARAINALFDTETV